MFRCQRICGRTGSHKIEKHVKYILLVHHNEDNFAKMPRTEQQQMRDESVRLANQIHADGQYLDAAPLHPTSMTTCVRVREGKSVITDGPFVETREHLGGYYLVDVENLQQAIAIAARIPGARLGAVEIRPTVELPGLPEISDIRHR